MAVTLSNFFKIRPVRFPTPIEDVLAAAQVQVAASGAFDPAHILSYLKGKAADVGHLLKSAISKVLGLYDAAERIIHIDDSAHGGR